MQKISIALMLAFILTSILSCQKEEFEGYNEIAVGRWECTRIFERKWNYATNQVDTIEHSFSTDLEILILDKGRICVYEGGRKRKSSRIESITELGSADLVERQSLFLVCPGLKKVLHQDFLIMAFHDSPDSFGTANLNYFQSESEISLGFHYVFDRIE
ncbi:hypothetical protein [Sanyastnella coralliicola]|uniref:hypothetical protein n=1 Tax=Sanyastnella coralliicola TaxID=3069118 RepID=UPI0027B88224|nr:hypothetical protein [Longitalea sp. SCSIO 12813]